MRPSLTPPGPSWQRPHAAERGFGLLDGLLVVVVIAILAAVAVPNLKSWSRSYRLRSACLDLYAALQLARTGAIKQNRPWTLAFNDNGYEVLDAAGARVRAVDFAADYQGQVLYRHPRTATKYDVRAITFTANGLANTVGFAYLSASGENRFCRVGVPVLAGTPKIETWTGTGWE
ncbi:MAG: hypothetical protein KatS3mg131_2787 [Candidatus Tectimicrobiota bacterium]|nr:MAG: hypothetical protein KatS3mg131_2787 [Candidatus Tectomicrobia bacterium]